MAYYCGECVVWVGSSDSDRYGRRWCSYSRRYEESNQNTYGCRGFVYNGRTIITKVCDILNLPKGPWYEAFDAVKEAYVVDNHMEWLSSYCVLGPKIADALEKNDNRNQIAQNMLHEFLEPAKALWQKGMCSEAAERYKTMVLCLAVRFQLVF